MTALVSRVKFKRTARGRLAHPRASCWRAYAEVDALTMDGVDVGRGIGFSAWMRMLNHRVHSSRWIVK
jgi:hypothetical protein